MLDTVPAVPPTGRVCFTVLIPPPPSLVGLTTYLTFATYTQPRPEPIPGSIDLSPRFDLKIE